MTKPAPAPAPAPATPAPIVPLTTIHPTSYDVRLRVEPDGTARVEHTLAVRVSGGPFRSLDLKASDPRSVVSGEPSIQSDDGRPGIATASLTVRENGVLHLQALEEKGWKRGAYTIRFALKTDLEASGALKRDGVMYRIRWPSPVLGDGIDGMRVVFDLPAAPTEPRAGGNARDDEENLLATLRRSAARDELEIVRPHVGRSEAVVWDVRLDPRALPAVRSPTLARRPLAPAPTAPAPTTPFALALATGAIVAALAFAKERSMAGTTRRSPPLLPVPLAVRLSLAGAAAASALVAFVEHGAPLGAMLVAITCALLAKRSAPSRSLAAERKARGPGEWLALRPVEVFAKLPASLMEFGSWRGRFGFVLAVLAFALLAWAGGMIDPRVPSTFALLVAVIPTLWAIDARSHLDRARALLARAHRRLAGSRTLRAVPFVRVPKGRTGFEEVRLRVLPRHPMPGLLALEMGSAGETIEILVRVRDDSPASRRLSHCVAIAACGALRTVPGRVAEERVLSLDATSPTLAAACRLATDLSDALVDRREAERAPYEGPERRGFADEPAANVPSTL